MFRITYFCLFLLILFSCNRIKETATESIETISVNSTEIGIVRASSFIESVETIHLQSEFPIGSIKQILTGHNYIFVCDAFGQKVFVFDWQGKLICLMNYIGSGPGEYIRIDALAINNTGDAVLIYDYSQRKVLEYEASTGRLIKSISMSFLFDEFVEFDNAFYSYSPTDNNFIDKNKEQVGYGLLEIDRNGKFVRNALNIGGSDKDIFAPIGIQSLSANETTVSILPVFLDTIFVRQESGRFYPKYYVDFGQHRLPKSLKYGDFSNPQNVSRIMESNYVFGKILLLNAKNFLHFVALKPKSGSVN